MYLYTKRKRCIDTEWIEKYVSRNVYMAWEDGRERRERWEKERISERCDGGKEMRQP